MGCFCMLLGTLLLGANLQEQAIPFEQAAKVFDLAEKLWNKDQGKLWGKPLNCPILLVDPKSRTVVTNAADTQGNLKPAGKHFTGSLPNNIPIANYSFTWSGVKWVMLMWPLPLDEKERGVLLMHEPFHRIQVELGFPWTDPRNAHLNSLEGRYWLQLEWRALRKALNEKGKPREEAVADALRFRGVRRELFPTSRVEELQLEMHEGLANYTGVVLSGMSTEEQIEYLTKSLDKASAMDSFTRSFAYLSGPAYGLLLDDAAPDWRKNLKSRDDLAEILRLGIKLPESTPKLKEAQERALLYNSKPLRETEQFRWDVYQENVRKYKKLFQEDAHFELPLKKIQTSFDPNKVIPIEGFGTIYETVTVMDEWGVIKVSKAALISADWKKLYVTAPTETKPTSIKGDGWELELKPGWTMEKGERAIDSRLKQGEAPGKDESKKQ